MKSISFFILVLSSMSFAAPSLKSFQGEYNCVSVMRQQQVTSPFPSTKTVNAMNVKMKLKVVGGNKINLTWKEPNQPKESVTVGPFKGTHEDGMLEYRSSNPIEVVTLNDAPAAKMLSVSLKNNQIVAGSCLLY